MSDEKGRLFRELYFPTFIYYRDLPDSGPLNRTLLDAIYRMREEDAVGLHRSNVKQAGSWHSVDDLDKREAFAGLVGAITAMAQEVFDDLQYEQRFEPRIDNMWANLSPRGGFNRMHTHPGVLWSGVYYVQAPPGSGRIFFADPRVQAQILRPRISDAGRLLSHNWAEVFYEPTAGRMLVFPAWLLHEVEPNLTEHTGSDADRISISFNLMQVPGGEENSQS